MPRSGSCERLLKLNSDAQKVVDIFYVCNYTHAFFSVLTYLRSKPRWTSPVIVKVWVLKRPLSITPGDDIYKYDLIVSTTDLTLDTYGADFFNEYAERMGITTVNDDHFTVLRSVVMDPWVTETTRLSATGKLETVSFIDTLEKEIRKAVTSALEELQPA